MVDALASAEGVDCRKLEKSAAVGRGLIEGKQVILVKPVTFMNNSGEAVSALARFYKVGVCWHEQAAAWRACAQPCHGLCPT